MMQIETSYNVLAPGPVNLHPKVQEALALPMIHHRTPEFDRILKRTLQKLQIVFQTSQPVFILSSTGSGGMEALLVNVLKPGDQVLGIDNGKFGERWCEMAKTFQAQLHVIKTKWGHPVDVREIKNYLDKNPETKIVFCQACETSTGALNPIQEIGDLIKNFPQTLFLVDGITALGALPLPMDQWHIDGLVGGSQKAFMLPTGLSFVSFSKKAWAIVEKNSSPRYYFDLRKEMKANQNGETFFSSNVTLIRALDVVLDLMLEKGLTTWFKDIELRSQFTRHFGTKIGFSLFSTAPSQSVTALQVPKGLDGQKIRSDLESRFKITIMGGQDQAKGQIIRIGHMGYIQWDQMKNLILSLAKIISEMNPELQLDKIQLETEIQNWIQNV